MRCDHSRLRRNGLRENVIRRAAEIQTEFRHAKPFRHVAIDNFLVLGHCESLLRDFPVFDEKRATNELGRIGRKAVIEQVSADWIAVLNVYFRRYPRGWWR